MELNIDAKNEEFIQQLKETILKNWDEEKKKEKEREDKIYNDLYIRMVKEAVYVIREEWKKQAKSTVKESNIVTLTAHNAFCISKNMFKLFSVKGHKVPNPETGGSCFYIPFSFKSQSLADEYIKDVLSLLPSDVTYVENEANDVAYNGMVKYFTFYLHLNMK
jgi:hypothetical protein